MALPCGTTGITKSDFRPCSTCMSCNQASFCLYTLRTISDRAEETFERLRYFLGGDRPSPNCPPDGVPRPDSRPMVGSQYYKGGIPRVTPPDWRPCFIVSHLSCTCSTKTQRQATVKLHGVFPSCRRYPASSPGLQFHRVYC